MSKLFGFTGGDDFFSGVTVYPNPKETSLFLPLSHYADVYYPPSKRSRISDPFIFDEERFEQKQASIEVLPDECLFEIFRRLPGGEERSACACVSKHWLSLLSDISCDEIKTVKENKGGDLDVEGDGFLSRSLEGKKANDIRLAAIAVGTASRGGLGKLSIRGSAAVTNQGLKAISRGCPSLKTLTLWNLSSIGDEGVSEIALGCHQLEKLDLCHCPTITEKSLIAIAENCPNMTDLTLESCSNIGNEGLQAVARICPNLKSVSIKDCLRIGDQGIAGLMSSASLSLAKVKLQSLNISDVSLAVIGCYGKAITDLSFASLPNVSERGFWIMGNGNGLQKLKSFSATLCRGVTDLSLEAVAKGCPNLKHFCLKKSTFLSDKGLVSFAKAAASLESLQLEDCHRITQFGVFGSLLNSADKLKTFSMANCLGIKDLSLGLTSLSSCTSLKSLSIRNCPGFGDASLSVLGKLCPKLQNLELTMLPGVTDAGFLSLLENSNAGLVKVNLSGCVNLSDNSVSSMVGIHGWTLEALNLDGCMKISDTSLVAIAENCLSLNDLDVSKCAITDSGVASLASSKRLNLQILSFSACSMISNKSVSSLKKLGRCLLGLNLQHCNGISSSAVDKLLEQLWRCDILF